MNRRYLDTSEDINTIYNRIVVSFLDKLMRIERAMEPDER